MNREEIIEKFLRLNPLVKIERLLWRADGRLEWLCKHNVGHTVYAPDDCFVHGCDRCCLKEKIREVEIETHKNIEKTF